MRQPSGDVTKAWATAVRAHPVLSEWLSDWYEAELQALPYAKENVAHAQGRCQVLGELVRFTDKAPDYAANPRGRGS